MRGHGHKSTWPGLIVTLIGTLALLLSACGGTTGPSGQQAVPDAQQIFHFQLGPGSNDIATMDPGLVQDAYSIIPIELTFPGLVALDSHLKITYYAASGAPDISADGKTYTWHVRSGLHWSDGSAIDASTYAFAINRSLSPCTASPVAYYLFSIKDATTFNGETCSSSGQVTGKIPTLIGDSLVVQDPQTLVITLAQPAAYFQEALSYPTSYAVPQALVQRYGRTWTNHLADGSGLGGGLFKVTLWDHAGHLTLDRNDAFWGTKAKLREIQFTIYKDTNTAYADYQTHKSDIGFPPSSQFANAKTQSDFHQIGVLWINYDALNWKVPPFDNVNVRQAFSLALDRDLLASHVLHGTVLPSYHIVPKGMPGYNPNLTLPDGSQNPAGDPAKAGQLMQGYVSSHCGGNIANCPKVTFLVPAGSADALNDAQADVGMWQHAFGNYPIKIQTIEFNTLITEAATKKLQMWAIAWIADYPDPQDWLSLQFLPTAQYNNNNVFDLQANGDMTQADALQDQTARLPLYQDAEQRLVNGVSWLSETQQTGYWQVRSYVANFTQDAQGNPSIVDQWPAIYIAQH
jgi:peptide/nickel transport system substrate-binding protein/oligopeptide transport system substrate-binding protein